jgi:hypothetical protein
LELQALGTLRGLLLSVLARHATNIAQDKVILAQLNAMRGGPTAAARTGGLGGREVGKEEASGASQANAEANAETEAETAAEATRVPPAVQEVLDAMTIDSEMHWKMTSAVHYRLTRKKILARMLSRIDQLIAYFECLAGPAAPQSREEEHPGAGEKGAEAESGDREDADVSKSMQDKYAQQDEVFGAEDYTELWCSHLVPTAAEANAYGSECSVRFDAAYATSDADNSPRREPSWNYIKRFKAYAWDATNPLLWPEI